MPDTLRLFVAVYPPPSVAEMMLAVIAGLDLPHCRATPRTQVHMTLQFIGDTAHGDLPAVTESFERAAAGIGAFTLRPTRLLTLPERGPARLIAAQTDTPAPLQELHLRLVTRLARRVRREREVFLPHFTLARFAGSGVRGLRIDAALDTPPFRVDRVVLVRSILKPKGAEHIEECACTLQAGAT